MRAADLPKSGASQLAQQQLDPLIHVSGGGPQNNDTSGPRGAWPARTRDAKGGPQAALAVSVDPPESRIHSATPNGVPLCTPSGGGLTASRVTHLSLPGTGPEHPQTPSPRHGTASDP